MMQGYWEVKRILEDSLALVTCVETAFEILSIRRPLWFNRTVEEWLDVTDQ